MRRGVAATVLLALWSLHVGAATTEAAFPELTGRVVDAAGLLQPSTEAVLTDELAAHETATGNQLVVVTVPSLQGQAIEAFGYQLGRHWGIGQAASSNGALLIIAPAERQVRMEVGYGLEGQLTDAVSWDIIQSHILPRFREGDFDGGVIAGTRAMVDALGGEYLMRQDRPSQRRRLPAWAFWVFVIFILMNSFGGRRRRGRRLANAAVLGSLLGGSRNHGGGVRWRLQRRRRRFRWWRRVRGLVVALIAESERTAIAAAIAEVERHTDAELVTVLAARSDDYRYIPVLWAALGALTVPSILLVTTLDVEVITAAQLAIFCVLALVFRLPPVLIRLIPREVRYWRASNMARRQFLQQGLHHTRGQSGLLIFVSEAEHYVEIIADRGINRRVPPERWQEIVAAFTRELKAGRTLAGFESAISQCGEILRSQVPKTQDNHNELDDRLILIGYD